MNHWLSRGQIRAARALLRWSTEELARQASLGLNTIKRAEARDGKTSLTAANELAIGRACEAGGVEFTNGDQPGVRLSKATAGSTERASQFDGDREGAISQDTHWRQFFECFNDLTHGSCRGFGRHSVEYHKFPSCVRGKDFRLGASPAFPAHCENVPANREIAGRGAPGGAPRAVPDPVRPPARLTKRTQFAVGASSRNTAMPKASSPEQDLPARSTSCCSTPAHPFARKLRKCSRICYLR
jgi:hypothetical protein